MYSMLFWKNHKIASSKLSIPWRQTSFRARGSAYAAPSHFSNVLRRGAIGLGYTSLQICRFVTIPHGLTSTYNRDSLYKSLWILCRAETQISDLIKCQDPAKKWNIIIFSGLLFLWRPHAPSRLCGVPASLQTLGRSGARLRSSLDKKGTLGTLKEHPIRIPSNSVVFSVQRWKVKNQEFWATKSRILTFSVHTTWRS